MGASVGGGPVGLFVVSIFSLILVFLLILYGSYNAYKGAKNKSSLGLLLGTLKVLLGFVLYFIASIIIYNNHGETSTITAGFISISLLLLTIGMLLIAISFVLYVKQHNRTLKALDAANRSGS